MFAHKRPLLLTQRAARDLRIIQAYTLERWGEQQWADYEHALFQALALLEEYPESGRQRAELGTGLRSHVVREHTIYYRVSDALILVLRIQHSRTNPSRRQDGTS